MLPNIFHYNHERYLAAFKDLPAFGTHQWVIGAIAPEKDFTGVLRKTSYQSIVVACAILILCILLVSGLVSRVIHSLGKITKEIKQIKDFNLKETPLIQSRVTEISYIADALQSMKHGLRSFQKYVPAALVRQLIKLGAAAEVGGEKKYLALLFTDIKDFTTISEHSRPDQLALQVGEYFDAMSNIIIQNRGTIDKYICDAIMAFWGAPLPETEPCQQVAKTAIESVRRLTELNARWKLAGRP